MKLISDETRLFISADTNKLILWSYADVMTLCSLVGADNTFRSNVLLLPPEYNRDVGTNLLDNILSLLRTSLHESSPPRKPQSRVI